MSVWLFLALIHNHLSRYRWRCEFRPNDHHLFIIIRSISSGSSDCVLIPSSVNGSNGTSAYNKSIIIIIIIKVCYSLNGDGFGSLRRVFRMKETRFMIIHFGRWLFLSFSHWLMFIRGLPPIRWCVCKVPCRPSKWPKRRRGSKKERETIEYGERFPLPKDIFSFLVGISIRKENIFFCFSRRWGAKRQVKVTTTWWMDGLAITPHTER